VYKEEGKGSRDGMKSQVSDTTCTPLPTGSSVKRVQFTKDEEEEDPDDLRRRFKRMAPRTASYCTEA
jgi:hypothetical protein